MQKKTKTQIPTYCDQVYFKKAKENMAPWKENIKN